MGIKEVFLGIYLVAYTYFSIGFFLSSILKPKVGTTSISIGIFFFSYIVGVVSRLKEELELLRFLSPFDYVLPMDLVRYGWERKFLVAAIIIMVLTIAASFFIYDKRIWRFSNHRSFPMDFLYQLSFINLYIFTKIFQKLVTPCLPSSYIINN